MTLRGSKMFYVCARQENLSPTSDSGSEPLTRFFHKVAQCKIILLTK